MTEPTYRNLFLRQEGTKISYSPASGGGSTRKNRPVRNRYTHGEYLKRRFEAIQSNAEANKEHRTALSLPNKDGIHLWIRGQAGKDMVIKSFDSRPNGIRLLKQYSIETEDGSIPAVIIYIPDGRIDVFLKKISDYLNDDKNTTKGNHKNAPFLEGIEDIRLAALEQIWNGNEVIIQDDDTSVWCEFWLRTLPENTTAVVESFRTTSVLIGIQLRTKEIIKFPERTVLIGEASVAMLKELLEQSADIAEIRPAQMPISFLIDQPPSVQAEFVEELAARMDYNEEINTAVLVLDTGVNNGHLLLQQSLQDEGMFTYDPAWGKNDHDSHGTAMSGLALLGDLTPILNSVDSVTIQHILESGKILPNQGRNPYHLYGYIVQQVINRVEIEHPNRKRIYCMAVTSEEFKIVGEPTAWSAAIDKLTSGADDNLQRLFVISAGNVNDAKDWLHYPEVNQTASVQDPAQSWNALTVGAYTEKILIEDDRLAEYVPVAATGTLSPYSTTSLIWDNKWANKPDIVMEGGNVAKDATTSYATSCDDLLLLSTWYRPNERQFESFGMTSGATALAARLAARIQSAYPDIWPETVRALMIHSAEWTPAMINEYIDDPNKKGSFLNLVRTCGYGVPDYQRATACLSNRLNLVIESKIQPFIKIDGDVKTNEMESFALPWPRAELLNLGETPVELKVTLSYFIEPGPENIGWKDRYRYPSHGLRFDLIREGENQEQFLARINKRFREEGHEHIEKLKDRNWLLGSTNRHKGSIHSDIWRGTAAEMATSNVIGIYPTTGWWKERAYLQKYNARTRYSLVVSLKTPATEIDIYTPVAIAMKVPIEIVG